MKTIIVYHETQALARRSRSAGPKERVSYQSIDQWDIKTNSGFDEVVVLTDKKPPSTKAKTKNAI
jgi:hypothetical protein